MTRQAPTPAELGFGALFAQMRDAVVVSDTSGAILLWNPAAERLFGWSAAEAIGRDVSLLVPDRLRTRHESGMRRFHATGRGDLVDRGAILELPAQRKDGSEVTVEMRLSRVDAGGDYVVALLRDVSDRVRLLAESEADRRRLREANETLEAFTYVVGHDLKEPVRAVSVYLDALEEHVEGSEARADLERVRAANERMRALLEGLLEWSRAALGGLDVAPLALGEVVEGAPCRTRYERALEERRARLRVAPGLPVVLATEALLCQVFGNLILNAIRHNPRADPLVEIVPIAARGRLAGVAVRDNGPGFPEDVKERVLGKAPHPRSLRGGFGLTIATRAVRALGGEIELADGEGGGAEARVWLPTPG